MHVLHLELCGTNGGPQAVDALLGCGDTWDEGSRVWCPWEIPTLTAVDLKAFRVFKGLLAMFLGAPPIESFHMVLNLNNFPM